MNIRNFRSSLPRHKQIMVDILVALALALLALVLFGPMLARPAYASHNSMEVECPDPITEGDTANVRVKRDGDIVKRVFAFTYIGDHLADSSDFQTYEGEKFTNASGSRSVYIPAITKEDEIPEPNETFEIGYWDDGVWHGCVITIVDDDEPEIASVVITSRPVEGLYYKYGESIDVTVTLDQEVEVDGTPLLALFIGEGDSTWRGAEYHSGSGTNSLLFRYKVQASDFDYDGLTVGAGATNDDRTPAYGFSGNIYAKGTRAPIDYAHSGITNAGRHLIEGRPMVRNVSVFSNPPDGWQAYRANQIIEGAFKFNTEVEVEGAVHVHLVVGYVKDNWNAAKRDAQYLRGSGSETLVFGYTVRPGDMDQKGIIIAAAFLDEGFKGDGKVKAKGTDYEAYPHFLGKDHLRDHKVDTAIPTISTVSIESRPANGEAYAAGENIGVAVNFNEPVTIVGDPHVELDVGGNARQAALTSDSPRSASAQDRQFGNKLTFQYQVAEGDADSDGIGISANSLKLNGGGIFDKAGNAAELSHDTVTADSAHRVRPAN